MVLLLAAIVWAVVALGFMFLRAVRGGPPARAARTMVWLGVAVSAGAYAAFRFAYRDEQAELALLFLPVAVIMLAAVVLVRGNVRVRTARLWVCALLLFGWSMVTLGSVGVVLMSGAFLLVFAAMLAPMSPRSSSEQSTTAGTPHA